MELCARVVVHSDFRWNCGSCGSVPSSILIAVELCACYVVYCDCGWNCVRVE